MNLCWPSSRRRARGLPGRLAVPRPRKEKFAPSPTAENPHPKSHFEAAVMPSKACTLQVDKTVALSFIIYQSDYIKLTTIRHMRLSSPRRLLIVPHACAEPLEEVCKYAQDSCDCVKTTTKGKVADCNDEKLCVECKLKCKKLKKSMSPKCCRGKR